jgi:transposase
MKDSITWVALDTSKKFHVAAILVDGEDEMREARIPNEPRAIRRFARKLVRTAGGGEVRVCYEAGPCGFALMRQLEAAAPLVCEVVAPALIPVRPGERIKTDRRDARKLVQYYRSGDLIMVHPPNEAQESVRDLVRCRESVSRDVVRARHRIAKFLLRRGQVYGQGRAWTQRYESWLAGLKWEQEIDRQTVQMYILGLSQAKDRLKALDEQIQQISESGWYREPVGWLRSFRGIDTITAMTILAEIYYFGRFSTARQLMGYLGLVPSEHSSGNRRCRGGLTRAGNGRARRILIEACWQYRHKPAVGRVLQRRRQGQPAWVIAHADRAMVRLYRRHQRLLMRGKHPCQAAAAVARELVGFIWAVMREGEARRGILQAREEINAA